VKVEAVKGNIISPFLNYTITLFIYVFNCLNYSTVAALLARFYDPQQGSVCLDGRDIRDLDPQSLRKNIAMVSQDVVLFSGTIADNIRYGSNVEEVSQELLEQAAMKANAHDFISAFPDGYQTQVGERGITLSGGQKQRYCREKGKESGRKEEVTQLLLQFNRIAIARAVINDAPILILDEATSALDSTSERAVQLALQHLMQGRSLLHMLYCND